MTTASVVASSTFYGGQGHHGTIDTSDLKNLELRSTALDVEVTSLGTSSSSNGIDLISEVKSTSAHVKVAFPPSQGSLPDAINEEWKQMFGGETDQSRSTKFELARNSPSSSPSPARSSVARNHQSPIAEGKSKDNLKLSERSKGSKSPTPTSGQGDSITHMLDSLDTTTECKSDLQGLIAKKRHEYNIKAKKDIGIMATGKNTLPVGWKPKGYLVAHLHEHQGYISKLARIPESSMFASGSADGIVRIWDCSKFEGSNVANTASMVLNHHQQSPITSLAADNGGGLLVSSSENGSVSVFQMETQSIIHKKVIDVDDEGPAISFHFCDTGRSSPLLIYSTPYGAIVGWDLRCPSNDGEAYRMELDLRDGIQTATAVSADQCWAVSGTSSGVLTCWDLRFRLPILKCTHPSEARIRDLTIPTRYHNSSSVWASVQGYSEVGLWNLESQYRQLVLWPSAAPLLASNPAGVSCNSDFISSLSCVQGNDLNVLLTAGTDRRIRYWDLMNYQESTIISGAGSETIPSSQVSYRSKLVDGTEVIQEIHSKSKNVMSPSPSPSTKNLTNTEVNQTSPNRPGLDGPSFGHLNWISSLTLCQSSHWYVVSGSRDGVIKVWR